MRPRIAFLWLLLLTSSTAPADPTWWEARGVKSTEPAANLAPATIGQAKHMAAMALAEIEVHLPAPAFQALETDLASIVDLALPDPLPSGFHESQRAILLTGQLKAISKPFYDHLRIHDSAWLDNALTIGNLIVMEPGSDPPVPSPYPWSEATTDDANRAPATLGQLKAVFSLPLETLTPPTVTDTDGDGMSDAWEIQNGFDPNNSADAGGDSDNDGINNLMEFQLGLSPNSVDNVGPLNFGFDEEIWDSPDLTFRTENPSDLYPADSVLHWRAAIGRHIEIWDEGDGNPYAELQSHWDAKGIEQEFNMLPGTRLTFILRYKGRYDGYNDSNPFFLKVEGAHEVLVNGQPAQTQGSVKQASFMADDEWEKYSGWHHASITIDTDPQATTLVPITLTLMPDSTDEAITYGGFVDLIPVDLDVNGDGDISDPCDDLATYTPGYELSTAKLHTGASFENSQYAGPQSMNIIIDNLPSSMADEAHIRILGASNWYGYCGNGSIANESPIMAYWDFSLDGQETVSSTQEASVTSSGNKMVIPIYCHDYGGSCEVEITLKKNGTTIGSPIKLTLPHDGNRDRLADRWQDTEITAWNTQFGDTRPLEDAERGKMKPGTGYDLADYADDEMKKSDGASGSMPEMADEGDGLKVIEEYRGFILDAGPGITSTEHRRLSIARKEALFQFLVMPQITDGSNPGNCANTAAQGFDAAQRFQAVHGFYESKYPGGGADLDCYMVELPLIPDASAQVAYQDGATRPAYLENAKLRPISGHTRPANALTYIYYDRRLYDEDYDEHVMLYSPDLKDTPVERAFERARSAAEALKGIFTLDHFAVCAFYNRFGFYSNATNWNIGVIERDGTAFSNHLEGGTPSNPMVDTAPRSRGIQFAVNAISENPANNFSNGQMDYAIAHEIGHTLIWARHPGHPGVYPGLMADFPSGTVVTSLSQFQIHSDVISLMDLRNRSSVDK